MKLKNSNEKLKLQKLFPVMYGASLVLVILRFLQLTRFIDSETGFFTGGTAINALVYVIIAAVCLFFTVFSFLSAQGKNIELAGIKDKGAQIAAVAFGITLLYDGGASFFDSIDTLNTMSFSMAASRSELFKLLMSSGALPYALESVFALLSAVYIFIVASGFSKGGLTAHYRKLLALAPIAWVAFKLITRFVKQISYIKVSDLFLELMMLALMILFFVAFAQVMSGVYSDDSRWRITALGLGGAMLSLSLNIPRLVLGIFADGFVNSEYPFNLADAGFAVFAIFVVIAAVRAADEETA